MSKEPKLKEASFVCPHCGIFASQNWIDNSSVKYDIHNIYENQYYRLRKNDYSKSQNIEGFLNIVKSSVLSQTGRLVTIFLESLFSRYNYAAIA